MENLLAGGIINIGATPRQSVAKYAEKMTKQIPNRESVLKLQGAFVSNLDSLANYIAPTPTNQKAGNLVNKFNEDIEDEDKDFVEFEDPNNSGPQMDTIKHQQSLNQKNRGLSLNSSTLSTQAATSSKTPQSPVNIEVKMQTIEPEIPQQPKK